MTAPQLPAFDPRDVAESNATRYPEPLRAANLHRYNRHLGNHAGLQNYGVVLARQLPFHTGRPLARRLGYLGATRADLPAGRCAPR